MSLSNQASFTICNANEFLWGAGCPCGAVRGLGCQMAWLCIRVLSVISHVTLGCIPAHTCFLICEMGL